MRQSPILHHPCIIPAPRPSGPSRSSPVIHPGQGRIIQPESSCIVYYTYYIILCIILCIIFTYDFKTIRPKSNSIIHNTQYNTYYVLIRIMYCHTLIPVIPVIPAIPVIPEDRSKYFK